MMKEKMDRMKASGEDEYKLKKQQEVYLESCAMIPDCQRRLQSASNELQTLLVCRRLFICLGYH